MNKGTKFWTCTWLAICLVGAIMIAATFFSKYGDAILKTNGAYFIVAGFITMLIGAIFTAGSALGASQKQTPPTKLSKDDIILVCRMISKRVILCMGNQYIMTSPEIEAELKDEIENEIERLLGLQSTVTEIENNAIGNNDLLVAKGRVVVVTSRSEVLNF